MIAAMRRVALNKLIDNRLIEQAARTAKVSVAQYLGEHVEQVTVSNQQVDEAYGKSAGRFPGQLPAEVKYRIRRTLEDNRRAEALRNTLQNLRREAKIKNMLAEGQTVQLAAAASEGPTMGRPDAPVSIIQFVDFECPYCRTLAPKLKTISVGFS